MEAAVARRDPRLERLAGLHVVLWAVRIAWGLIESTPRTAAALGGGFEASLAGRALAMITVLGGVAVAVAIVVTTFRSRRRPSAIVLLAVLVASIARRGAPDAFDVAYLVVVPAVAAWVLIGRRLQSAAA